jgi:tRNA 2-thiouridine synthesizing protein A
MTDIVVDARGHRCPTPTLRLARALEAAAPGALVTLIADDPLARIDVPHYAAAKGHEVVSCQAQEGRLTFIVRKALSPQSA